MVTEKQKELTDLLNRMSAKYYLENNSPMSDTEFDLKLKELQAMEKESGEVLPYSPTLRVGSDLQKAFGKITHPKSMFTIENSYDDSDLRSWVSKMENTGANGKGYNVSVKYDGISCELDYVGGVLKSASTRGNKLVGDDITENVKTIWNIPMKLPIEFAEDEHMYVRGEILLPKSRLSLINESREAHGETAFANTRNACSGSVKQLDPKVTASRGLIFRAWDCFGDNVEFSTMSEKTEYIVKLGFQYEKGTEPFHVESYQDIMVEVQSFKDDIDKMNLDFDYDGVVVKIEDVAMQDSIGIKDTRAIEWAMARKWNEENEATTRLLDVDFQVGRSGVLTPVARLEPVYCSGVLISNATLHNMDFINELNIKKGDMLKITRSGGVIPYVLGVVDEDKETVEKHEIVAPEVCPVCGAPVVKDGAQHKCTNPKCAAQMEGKVLQFCSKDCMDIRGVGESVVHDLFKSGLVKTYFDLYTLEKRESVDSMMWILGSGYGTKSITSLLEAIETSKKKPLASLLASISIPGVGKVVGRVLAGEFGSLRSIAEASVADLMSLDGIGDIMAQDIHDYFQNNPDAVDKFEELGLTVTADKGTMVDENAPLSGLKLVFSGKSGRFSGDEVEEFLESLGAKCGHSVSGKTNFLIVGDAPGSAKVAKATSIGVEIIKEDDFYEKYGI